MSDAVLLSIHWGLASLHTAQAQAKAQSQAEAARQHRNHYGRIAQVLSGGCTAAPSKCKCCGSHEFRAHAGRTICAYCRTDGR